MSLKEAKTGGQPSLLIIIVNYRTGELVADCLRSLFGPTTMPDDTVVVVVDNASNDTSVDVIQSTIASSNAAGRAVLLPLSSNGGFSLANNLALEHANARFGSAQYVLFLNPDTVARPASVVSLVKFLDSNPTAGVAGARLEDPDGTPQACAFHFPSVLGEFESEARFGPVSRLLRRWRIAEPPVDRPIKVDWVSGAALLIRGEILQAIGSLDPTFFLYYEEVDLCMRVKRAGWSIWHVPQSRIIHLVGCSTGVTKHVDPVRRPSYWFDSRRHFYRKNHGLTTLWLADLAWVAGHLIWQSRLAAQRRKDPGPPKLLRDFLAHSSGIRHDSRKRRAS